MLPGRRYRHACEVSQVAKADDVCFLCGGPLQTVMPKGWVPSDHTGTFATLSGTTWSNFKVADSGAASYISLLERGYSPHELTFAILFLLILAIPFRAASGGPGGHAGRC
jgi:hypothetical protein